MHKSSLQPSRNLGTLTKHDIQVIGISPDANASHEKFATKYDLSFPLVADTDHKIMKSMAYGERRKLRKPTWGFTAQHSSLTRKENRACVHQTQDQGTR
ncbi:MAG: hypothetical protein CM15mP49_07290 [Actinomycetota bacterium]|nr:MAG: hypothetical protein CM15mP49_07290 [Actinomycetota bacterium]